MENQPTEPVATEPVATEPVASAPPQPVVNEAPAQAPPQPPAKKSKKGLIIGIIIAVVAVIAGVVIAVIFLFQGIMGAGSAEATAFVDDIKNNRLEAAYARFAPELKEVQDFQTFSYQVSTLNLDPSCNYNANSAEISVNSGGRSIKETAGRIECASKAFNAEFKFVQTNNEYLLYMFNIQPLAGENQNTNNNNNNSSTPSNLAGLRLAMTGRKAMNCTITHIEEGTAMIQANDGWTKVRISSKIEGEEVNILMLKGDGMYTWSSEGAFKLAYDDTFFDNMTSEYDIDENSEDYSKISLRCENPSKANFNLPAGVEFETIENDLDY